jgi:hypothetical protein
MLVLVEGSQCEEGNATLGNRLQQGKLEHEIEKNRGNFSPQIWENGSQLTEGIKECAELIELRRQKRIFSKDSRSYSPQLATLGT